MIEDYESRFPEGIETPPLQGGKNLKKEASSKVVAFIEKELMPYMSESDLLWALIKAMSDDVAMDHLKYIKRMHA